MAKRRLTKGELAERLGAHLEPTFRELHERAETAERETLELREKATNFGPFLAQIQDAAEGGYESDMYSRVDSNARTRNGKGNRFGEFLRAKVAGDTAALKALQAGTDSAGGTMVPERVSEEIIPQLQAASVVSRFNPVTTRLDGNSLTFPRIDSGATAQWIGEGEQAPSDQQTTGGVTLVPKKLALVIPVSNDLVRRVPSNVQQVLADDAVTGINAQVDLAWIRGSGTGGQPAGFRNQPGITTTASNGNNVANITDDLGQARQALMDANVPMTRPGWLISPRTERALFTALDANSNPVFRPEMAQGRIFGIPFAVTTQIPTNLGGGNETEVYLVDFAQVIIGDQVPISVQAFDAAAYHDGSSVVSSLSRDETVLRFIVETDLGLRHAAAIHVTTGVTWGA